MSSTHTHKESGISAKLSIQTSTNAKRGEGDKAVRLVASPVGESKKRRRGVKGIILELSPEASRKCGGDELSSLSTPNDDDDDDDKEKPLQICANICRDVCDVRGVFATNGSNDPRFFYVSVDISGVAFLSFFFSV